MQPKCDWMPAAGLKPGPNGAKAAPQPGSQDTRFIFVSPAPASLGAHREHIGKPVDRKQRSQARCTDNQSRFPWACLHAYINRKQTTASLEPGTVEPACVMRARLQ